MIVRPLIYSPDQLSFFAHQLTRRAASSSKGVMLADEVGLGKIIQAGLLIAQRCAERKRDGLIDELEQQLKHTITQRIILRCEWELQ